jgi:hypothetical protein
MPPSLSCPHFPVKMAYKRPSREGRISTNPTNKYSVKINNIEKHLLNKNNI